MGSNDDIDEAADMENDHDDGSFDMFGEPNGESNGSAQTEVSLAHNAKNAYLVLARKYRPMRFEDLIGQDAMVTTLTNAFSQNRIAHAFMLTGVRGVGKTTTARLIARALNYSSPGFDAPNMELSTYGIHCDAIINGRHPDVMELDAASNTGVEKMRDLLDNSRYGPISARYKVYIIDEVHMLSINAFNALLKTLEEPPPHTKFIFATTENRKVPVTILSRCQRFDLKRVERKQLTEHLEKICVAENVSVEKLGLEQISRAAEGSVRDALSLLDQALVQESNGTATTIGAEKIRDMLGLSDRNRIFDLFAHILAGDTKSAIIEVHNQYQFGADPTYIIQGLMEIAHEVGKVLSLGLAYKDIESGDGYERLSDLAKLTTNLGVSRIWQMMLTGLEETRRAPDPLAAIDMCILRLCGAAQMPTPEDLVRIIENGQIEAATPKSDNSGSDIATSNTQKKNQIINQTNRSFSDFQEMLNALETEIGERALVADLECFAKPISVIDGIVRLELIASAPTNLRQRLAAALAKLTSQEWKVYLEQGGGETIREGREKAKNQDIETIKALPQIKTLFELFPGLKITAIEASNDHMEIDNNLEESVKSQSTIKNEA